MSSEQFLHEFPNGSFLPVQKHDLKVGVIGLLLERFVHCRAVLGAHLVQLVDYSHATIREDQHPSLEDPATSREIVLDRRRGKARGGRSLAARVDRTRRDLRDIAKELAFCGTGVTDDEHVDVAAGADAVRVALLDAAEHLQRDRLLLLLHPPDGRRKGEDDLVHDGRVAAEGQDDGLLFGRDLDLVILDDLRLDGDPQHQEVERRVANDAPHRQPAGSSSRPRSVRCDCRARHAPRDPR